MQKDELMDKNIKFEECGETIARSMGLDNLATIAPHKIKYIESGIK